MIESISLVIPCYNEAATIDEFYRRANELASSLDTVEQEAPCASPDNS